MHIPKIYVHPGLEIAVWQTLRCGSNSLKGLLKRSGFTVGEPRDDWLHIALIRDPYERYLSSLWIAATGDKRDWDDFLVEVEQQNQSGPLYTWNEDQHFVPQVDHRVGMTDPMMLLPLERVGELDAVFKPRRGVTHVNVTDPGRKMVARERISPEPVLAHYATDAEVYSAAYAE